MANESDSKIPGTVAELIAEPSEAGGVGVFVAKVPDPPREEEFGDNDFVLSLHLTEAAWLLIAALPEFEDLAAKPYRPIVVWKKKGGTSNGKGVFGKCTKLSGLPKFFAERAIANGMPMPPMHGRALPWLIWLAADHTAHWRDPLRWEALLVHELTHCELVEEEDKDGDVTIVPSIRAHDVEEFGDVVRRYGAWNSDLKSFGQTVRQLSLWA